MLLGQEQEATNMCRSIINNSTSSGHTTMTICTSWNTLSWQLPTCPTLDSWNITPSCWSAVHLQRAESSGVAKSRASNALPTDQPTNPPSSNFHQLAERPRPNLRGVVEILGAKIRGHALPPTKQLHQLVHRSRATLKLCGTNKFGQSIILPTIAVSRPGLVEISKGQIAEWLCKVFLEMTRVAATYLCCTRLNSIGPCSTFGREVWIRFHNIKSCLAKIQKTSVIFAIHLIAKIMHLACNDCKFIPYSGNLWEGCFVSRLPEGKFGNWVVTVQGHIRP